MLNQIAWQSGPYSEHSMPRQNAEMNMGLKLMQLISIHILKLEYDRISVITILQTKLKLYDDSTISVWRTSIDATFKGKDGVRDRDLVKYVDVGATYCFNKTCHFWRYKSAIDDSKFTDGWYWCQRRIVFVGSGLSVLIWLEKICCGSCLAA